MTKPVEHDLIYLLNREVRLLRDQTADFSAEFAAMSDADLDQMIVRQNEIAEDAQWRADAAAAEVRLRRLKATFSDPARSNPARDEAAARLGHA